MSEELEMYDDGIPARGSVVAPVIQTDRILEFLKAHLSPKQKPKLKTVALAHLVPDNGGGTILTKVIDLPEKATLEQRNALARELTGEIERAAAASASTHDRPQRYGICCYGPNDIMMGRWDMLVGPPRDSFRAMGGESEPPTGVGVLSQSMRFSEAAMRLLCSNMQMSMANNQEENERLRRRCTEYEDRHLESLKLMADLLDKKQERDLALTEKKAEQERAMRAWVAVEKLIPAVLQKYGFDMPAGESAAGGFGIKAFLSSLTGDQKLAICNALTEEQLAQLQALLKGAPGMGV